MSTMATVLTVILCVVAVFLSAIVLLQSKRSAGLGPVSSSSDGNSYWNQNKHKSLDGTLERWTKIGGALFMLLAFAINLLLATA